MWVTNTSKSYDFSVRRARGLFCFFKLLWEPLKRADGRTVRALPSSQKEGVL